MLDDAYDETATKESDDAKKANSDDAKKVVSFDARVPDLSRDVENKSESEIVDYLLSKDDSEITPWECVELPSRGVFYNGRIPGGMVEVRPMNIYVEKIMSTVRFARSGQAIDKVFEYCVRFPDQSFTPGDLLAGDSTFLLFYLRGVTYGNMYEFSIQCDDDDCGKTMIKQFDLNQLAGSIQYADLGHKEPFELVLPSMSKMLGKDFRVKVRLLRRHDVSYMINNRIPERANVSPRKKSGRPGPSHQSIQLNDVIEKNLNLVITEIMGETNRNKIARIVKKFNSLDTSYIREFIDDVSPGIDTTIEFKCDECSNSMKVSLPLTETFFRGKVGGGDGAYMGDAPESDNGT